MFLGHGTDFHHRLRKETGDQRYYAPMERENTSLLQLTIISCYRPFRERLLHLPALLSPTLTIGQRWCYTTGWFCFWISGRLASRIQIPKGLRKAPIQDRLGSRYSLHGLPGFSHYLRTSWVQPAVRGTKFYWNRRRYGPGRVVTAILEQVLNIPVPTHCGADWSVQACG